MARSLLPIAALLCGIAFMFLAGGISGLLLPLRGAHEGMSTFWLGLLGTGWAVGYVGGCLRVPRLVATVGHVRAFGVMSALASLSLLATLLVVHPVAWVGFRAIMGFAFAGAAMIVESWLVDRSDPAMRGRVFGTYTMVILGASTLGQLSLAIGDATGPILFVLAAMLCTLALIPTAVSSSSSPNPLLDARLDLAGMWRNSPLAMVGVVLIGLSNGTFGTLGAVYADRLALGTGAITLFVALPVLAGALAQTPVGHLSDRLDRRHVLAGVAALALALDIAFVQAAPASASVAIAMSMGLGVAIFTMYPVLVAHANDHAPPGASIRTSGTLLLLYGAGSIAGPLVAGSLMASAGPQGLFLVLGFAHVCLLGYTAWRLTRRAGVRIDDKTRFHRQAPTTTPQTLAFGHADDAELADEGVDVTNESADDRPLEHVPLAWPLSGEIAGHATGNAANGLRDRAA